MKFNLLTIKSVVVIMGLTLYSCGSGQNETNESAEGNEITEESATETAETSTVNANLDASTVMWKATMVGMYAHEGTLNFSDVSLEMTGDEITGGSFTVDLSTISPTDQNFDPSKDKTPENLVGHLQSADFFDVANYPTANFAVTGMDGNSITGNLTIRGISNEETVENVSFDEASNTWSATLTFDRKKYDVAWDSPMKEMILSDDIELAINLSL